MQILQENRVSLTALAKQEGVSASTVWRWTTRGIRGVRLESLTVGGRRYTSLQAFARFVLATQISGDGVSSASRCPGAEQMHAQAEAFLLAEGI